MVAYGLWVTLQICGAAATVLSARSAPLSTARLLSFGAVVGFVISFLYGFPILGHAPLTPRWNIAALKMFEVVGLGSGPILWMQLYGCKKRWLGMESGVYLTVGLLVNILWTVQVEIAARTATTVCGTMRLLQAAGLMFSLIVRAKTLHGAGAKLAALEHDVVVFHPVSSAWVVGYYCWNILFVSATGSPDRTIHNLMGILAMVIGHYIDPCAGNVNLPSRFLGSRVVTLAAFGVMMVLLECVPFFRSHINWSRVWGASDEPIAVFVSTAVAVFLLGDLTSACFKKHLKHWKC